MPPLADHRQVRGLELGHLAVDVDQLGACVEPFEQRVGVVEERDDRVAPEMLREAVAIRDASGAGAELEASGGVNLEAVRAIAETGIERLSAGATPSSTQRSRVSAVAFAVRSTPIARAPPRSHFT